MALIKCPECGTQISDKAAVCIHCGFPLPERIETEEDIGTNLEKEQTIIPGNEENNDTSRTSKVKRILVIVLGCIALTISLFITLTTVYYLEVETALYIFEEIVVFGAMIFHHVTKKKGFPVVLSSIALFLMVSNPIFQMIRFNISLSTYLSYRWLSILFNFSNTFLLFLYTITGRKKKDSIVWFIIYLGLMMTKQIVYFSANIFYIINLVHTVLFFSLGYSPDKWYRKKQHVSKSINF